MISVWLDLVASVQWVAQLFLTCSQHDVIVGTFGVHQVRPPPRPLWHVNMERRACFQLTEYGYSLCWQGTLKGV